MNREEHKRKLIRERVARHRERKAEAAEVKQERDELIKEYGERFLNLEHTNLMCQMALHILDFFKYKPSKVTAETVEECIDLVSRWMDVHYEQGWDLPDIRDQFRQASQMGLLPKHDGHIRDFFERCYEEFKTQGEQPIEAKEKGDESH